MEENILSGQKLTWAIMTSFIEIVLEHDFNYSYSSKYIFMGIIPILILI
jgi:hypothetical protein